LGSYYVITFVRGRGLYDVLENAFILPDMQDRGTAGRTIPILPPPPPAAPTVFAAKAASPPDVLGSSLSRAGISNA
jgi:hypothetical protein